MALSKLWYLLLCHFFLTDGVYRNHGSHFEKAKTAFEEGAANDEPVADDVVDQEKHSSDNESGNEKKAIIREEKA